MSLYRMFDASEPPQRAPGGCQLVMGYIGREGYTPHVWTIPEWQRFAGFRQVPIWVPDLGASPAAEAQAATSAAFGLGWAKGRAIVIDFETAGAPERSWWDACADAIDVAGMTGVAYGSASTVFQLDAGLDGLVGVADWDGEEDLEPQQSVVFHQYQANKQLPGGGLIDLSIADEWLYLSAGVGPRHD